MRLGADLSESLEVLAQLLKRIFVATHLSVTLQNIGAV
jgi:hypothetical protein